MDQAGQAGQKDLMNEMGGAMEGQDGSEMDEEEDERGRSAK